MSSELRVQLPPLDELTADCVLAYACLDRQGRVGRQGQATATQLVPLAKGCALSLLLHEVDRLQLALELPPLPSSRLSAAVQCAVQGLILGDTKAVFIAHGPRQTSGQVAVAWLGHSALQRLGQWLDAARLKADGLYAEGTLQGPRPAWGLQAGLRRRAAPAEGWGRALVCCGVAVLIWVLGLNLYAAHLAAQGQAIRQRMVEQVRQHFPQLPVVLNPLQQARQQVEAGPDGSEPALMFSRLLDEAATAMPFLAGSVEQLDFRDGRLLITPRPGAARVADPSRWQADLSSRGIEASSSAEGWTLRPAAAATEDLAHVE